MVLFARQTLEYIYTFRRQHPVEGFILDFFCAEANLAIELDGAGHRDRESQEYDNYRD